MKNIKIGYFVASFTLTLAAQASNFERACDDLRIKLAKTKAYEVQLLTYFGAAGAGKSCEVNSKYAVQVNIPNGQTESLTGACRDDGGQLQLTVRYLAPQYKANVINLSFSCQR